MYNYKLYQRQQKIANQCKTTYQHFLEENKNRRTITDTLYKNHKKRVEAFMLSSIDDPIQINEYKHPKYQPRGFLSEVKPQKSFRLNYHNTQQRLQGILQKNSYLDGVPFNNASIHKFREKQIAIHKKPFKFMVDSRLSTLKDSRISFKAQELKQTQNVEKKRQIHKHYSSLYKLKDKSLLNEFNSSMKQSRKAYFNSLRTFLVDKSNFNTKEYYEHQKEGHDKNDYDNQRETKRNFKVKTKQNQEISQRSKALQALTKCGFLKSTEPNHFVKSSLRG